MRKKIFCVLIIFLWITLHVTKRNLESEIYIIQNNRTEITEKIKEASKYSELCKKGELFDNKKYKKSYKPFASIIVPVYNSEKYLLTSLRSIQNQKMKDFEIIFIDDYSTDNSRKIIKELQKEEERIVFITNIKNRGTLTTRIIGVLSSKGRYIKFMDSDDLLLPILHNFYNYTKNYKIDIIENNVLINRRNVLRNLNHKHPNKVLLNEDIMNLVGLIPDNGHYLLHVFLWSYFIRRNVMFKAINFIGDYYINQHVCMAEDWIISYSILKTGKSYRYFENFGYIYNLDYVGKKSYGRTWNNLFVVLKFFFERTSNSFNGKKVCDGFFNQMLSLYQNSIYNLSEDNKNIIKLYLNCKFILKETKNKFLKLNKKINMKYYK